MYFEVLSEDQSGGIALKYLLEKIIDVNSGQHSYNIRSFKGIGKLPKNLKPQQGAQKKLILNMLPTLLKVHGKIYQNSNAAIVVVVDLDDKDALKFKQELLTILESCNPKPKTLFGIAIEEGEAWFLGDNQAIKKAYPNVKDSVLNSYKQDSICGTWETLADAIYQGGSAKLKKEGFPITGQVKCKWAKEIAPHMDIDHNLSKSFQVFRDGIKKLATENR